jgi:hypothetical protein
MLKVKLKLPVMTNRFNAFFSKINDWATKSGADVLVRHTREKPGPKRRI